MMMRILLLSCFMILNLASKAQKIPTSKVDSLVSALATDNSPGLSVAVVKNGIIECSQQKGLANLRSFG
jgi:hypothetical protein